MKKIGSQTIQFINTPTIIETSSIVGPKESQGPLATYFDQCLEDEFWGEETWEKAESKIIKENVNSVILKSGIAATDIDFCFAVRAFLLRSRSRSCRFLEHFLCAVQLFDYHEDHERHVYDLVYQDETGEEKADRFRAVLLRTSGRDFQNPEAYS